MKMSAPDSMRQQCSNTRMAKSKNMSYAPASMSAPPLQMMRNSAPQMRGSSPPMEQMMQQQMIFQACDLSNAGPPPLSAGPRPSPSQHKSAVRDEMLLNFTVLQNTDGSYSYGPAFAQDLNMTEADIDAGGS